MNGNRRTRSLDSAKLIGNRRHQNLCQKLLLRMPLSNRFCCSLPCVLFGLLAFSSVISLALIGFLVFSDSGGIFIRLPSKLSEQQSMPAFLGPVESKLDAQASSSSPPNNSIPLLLAIQNGSLVPLAEQIPVLVFCAKRPLAIENHLKQLLRLRPSPDHFPIIVSQDGDEANVANKIGEFAGQNARLFHIKHSIPQPATKLPKTVANYYWIAQHYKWALDQLFVEMGFRVAIITEDDLDIAADFFAYFNATRQLLYSDPTIWCISAWNDNGNPALVDWEGGGAKLWRTDFFPGLGWMLRAELWNELKAKWPDAFWDDWLRQQNIRKDRVCIRPEISRTLHNAAVAGKGSSNGLYKKFLASMRLPENVTATNFLGPMDFLKKENFDISLAAELKEAKEISLKQMLEATPRKNDSKGSFVVRYKDPKEFRQLANKFGMMADIRAGMARTSYYGVVPFFVGGIQFYAVHPSMDDFNKLDRAKSSQIYDQGWDKMSKYLDFAELYCTPKRYTGKCDPNDEAMRQWFRTKGWMKRLEQWGEMTVIL